MTNLHVAVFIDMCVEVRCWCKFIVCSEVRNVKKESIEAYKYEIRHKPSENVKY